MQRFSSWNTTSLAISNPSNQYQKVLQEEKNTLFKVNQSTSQPFVTQLVGIVFKFATDSKGIYGSEKDAQKVAGTYPLPQRDLICDRK